MRESFEVEFGVYCSIVQYLVHAATLKSRFVRLCYSCLLFIDFKSTLQSGEVPMKFILGSIPNGAGTMVLWFCVVSYSL